MRQPMAMQKTREQEQMGTGNTPGASYPFLDGEDESSRCGAAMHTGQRGMAVDSSAMLAADAAFGYYIVEQRMRAAI